MMDRRGFKNPGCGFTNRQNDRHTPIHITDDDNDDDKDKRTTTLGKDSKFLPQHIVLTVGQPEHP
jgi:hypothetical protein